MKICTLNAKEINFVSRKAVETLLSSVNYLEVMDAQTREELIKYLWSAPSGTTESSPIDCAMLSMHTADTEVFKAFSLFQVLGGIVNVDCTDAHLWEMYAYNLKDDGTWMYNEIASNLFLGNENLLGKLREQIIGDPAFGSNGTGREIWHTAQRYVTRVHELLLGFASEPSGSGTVLPIASAWAPVLQRNAKLWDANYPKAMSDFAAALLKFSDIHLGSDFDIQSDPAVLFNRYLWYMMPWIAALMFERSDGFGVSNQVWADELVNIEKQRRLGEYSKWCREAIEKGVSIDAYIAERLAEKEKQNH